ncbi:hypothetical protein [Neptuniibacter sp. QD37_11]|uniref:hypothetical protein n=1 Tax=Neptuniibacter sp. QD37_11 TaxID=3398209 RepID=UPI0039F4A508
MTFVATPKTNSNEHDAYIEAQRIYRETPVENRDSHLINELYLMSAPIVNFFRKEERELLAASTFSKTLKEGSKKLNRQVLKTLLQHLSEGHINKLINEIPPEDINKEIKVAFLRRNRDLLSELKPGTVTIDMIREVYIDGGYRKTISPDVFQNAVERRAEESALPYLKVLSPCVKSAEYWSEYISRGEASIKDIPRRHRGDPGFMDKLIEMHPDAFAVTKPSIINAEQRKQLKREKAYKDKNVRYIPEEEITQEICTEFYALRPSNILRMPSEFITPEMVKSEIVAGSERLSSIDIEAIPLTLMPDVLTQAPEVFERLESTMPGYLELAKNAIKSDPKKVIEVRLPRNHLLKSSVRVSQWVDLLECVGSSNDIVRTFLSEQILAPLLKEFKAARRLKPRAMNSLLPLINACERLGSINIELNAYYCDKSA